MPKVSVVVPIYGVEKYIERCVRSLFSQTLDDIEFIFIDDCTIDNSMMILEKLIKEYDEHINNMHWTIVRNKMQINSGLPSVRKRGVELSTGAYILHCDSDDWIDKNMVFEMWNMAVQSDLDVVICDYYEVAGNSQRYFRGAGTDCSTVFIDIFKCSYSWALWNKLIKRSVYANSIVFPKENIGEDMALTLQLLYFGNRIGHLEKAMYYYFKNPNSMTQTKTVEQVLNNVHQWKENVCILDDFYKQRSVKLIPDIIVLIKYMVKNSLLPIMGNKRYLRIWKNTFREINFAIYFSPYICVRSKVFFLLTYLGLYPTGFSSFFKR